MALASTIQRSLLPATPPTVPGLSLAARCRYCDETGGDYYDFFPDPGGRAGRLGLVVGDVTGHGLEAALLMTNSRLPETYCNGVLTSWATPPANWPMASRRLAVVRRISSSRRRDTSVSTSREP